jgi:Tol biopolymer transport system component
VTLRPDQTVAHYRIDRKLGEGGMGEVWVATDTRLNRKAAIKSLPPAVAADPERLARFTREAQVLAALNHPNIAAIYGMERDGDTPYLALEMVEGEDLSDRLARGKIPIDETVEIALQIAAALEDAHEKGIVHRDLKPANIKVAGDGTVKVLDFGLAKALSDDPDLSGASVDLSHSPTMTAALGTQAGVILGTAAYMSPEQARGKRVDRRADIWAFGVILYEMLTGDRLFPGDTVTDIIAAVVTREPDWDRLPADTPDGLRRVLRRCLQKDPRERLRHVGDAALELNDPSPPAAAAAVAASPSRRGGLLGLGGVIVGAALMWAAISLGEQAPESIEPVWTNLEPPAMTSFESFLELSPDGRAVVFVARSATGEEPVLWVRRLDDERARELEGTEGAEQPFWSPDSRSVAFFARGKLRRIPAEGGASQVLASTGNAPRGGCWGPNGTILYVPDWSRAVYRVGENGGEAVEVTTLNEERLELSHRWPHLLPDGRHFLFFAVSTYPELNPDNPAEEDRSGLFVASLDGGEPTLLHTARSRAVYRDGRLYYVDDGILLARPFDATERRFTGEAVAIASRVTQSAGALWGGALFSVAETGRILFVRGAQEERTISQLTWVDRQGRPIGTIGAPDSHNSLRLSNDETRLAVSTGDPDEIWIHDLVRGTPTRFTFDTGSDAGPVWSPDDRSVLFTSTRVTPGEPFMPIRIFRKDASGSTAETPVAASREFGATLLMSDWSPDGKYAIGAAARQYLGSDLVSVDLGTGEFDLFLSSKDSEQAGRFSPDGRWLAYESDVTGEYEVYIRPFPSSGGEWQVSDGGWRPVWRGDGRELYYVSGDRKMMAVSVETGETFRHDVPRELFDFEGRLTVDGWSTFDVTDDGSRFVIMLPVEDEGESRPTVSIVDHWSDARSD